MTLWVFQPGFLVNIRGGQKVLKLFGDTANETTNIDNPSQDLYDSYCLQLVINLGMLLLLNLKFYYLRCFYIFQLHCSLSCV